MSRWWMPRAKPRATRRRCALQVEVLDERLAPATVRFAAIGDFGADSTAEQKVADLVHSWNPDFVITLGDNNYPSGSAATIDSAIGKYYHDFIYPYMGSYGAGATTNRFWPSLGNHDWGDLAVPNPGGAQPHIDYFTLPGNERYYRVRQGPVELFALDSDRNEPDGYTSTSMQAQWLQAALASSTAPWKVVYFHHPPYSSGGSHGATLDMRWPFQQWGASAVFSGHDHHYERLIADNNFPYFINGLSGGGPGWIATRVPESQAGFDADYGAILVTASDDQMHVQFVAAWDYAGQVMDSYTLHAAPGATVPAAPSLPGATATGTQKIDVTWRDNSSNEDNFVIERSTDGATYSEIGSAGRNRTTYSDTSLSAGVRYHYRVRARNGAGTSAATSASAETARGPATQFVVSGPASTVAGQPLTTYLTALDAFGNKAAGYNGSVRFTSSDGAATLPANYTFAGDRGEHTFTEATVLRTAGTRTITATDTAAAGLTATWSVSVNAAPGAVRFAVIGDYGSGTTAERKVSDLVHSWNPDFVVTLGNNNYPSGSAATIDTNIGQYYRDFIAPYTGSHGAGSATNRFWPALGSSDYNPVTGYSAFLDYFRLPGNERHYSVNAGPVELFFLNSDYHEPSRYFSTSPQGTWLQQELAGSTATWKLVVSHAAPFSSTLQAEWMQWPFQQWGASALLSSRAHNYERIIDANGFPYFVNGLGGKSRDSFGTPVAGSQVRYNGDYGAMLITADAGQITFQFAGAWDFPGQVFDSYTIAAAAPAPPAASNLSAVPGAAAGQIALAWQDNSSNETGFTIERSSAGGAFSTRASVGANVTTYTDSGLSPGTRYDYRVRATSAGGSSAPSNQAGEVARGTAAAFQLSGSPSTSAGQPWTFTVTTVDAFGNVANSYTGTIGFTSSDAQASLPANYTFTAADAGRRTFTATLRSAGSRSVTATSTTTPVITGSQSGINVAAAAATSLRVTGPTSTTAGQSWTFTLKALDAYGNVAAGYRGSVRFTSSDTKAVLPANYTFTAVDAGVRTFSATLKTSGSQSLTATATTTPIISGTQSGIAVAPGAATRFIITGPSSVARYSSFSITVTAVDAYGNRATGYAGSVRFTSTDSRTSLPSNYKYTTVDAGRRTFNSLVLRTRGSQRITVTDTITGSILGSINIWVW